jgi:multidrug efflux pump subunit AcrB
VKPLFMAYALAVLASGLVAATVTPALACVLLGRHSKAPARRRSLPDWLP